MERDKVAIIGTRILQSNSVSFGEFLRAFFSDKININARMLITLKDYLTEHSKKFDRVFYGLTYEESLLYPNGTFTGILGMVQRSEVDIGVDLIIKDDIFTKLVDFAYPYNLDTVSFTTRKAEYKPHIFDILKTFSLPLWIAIISTLMAMSLVYYVAFKRRYSFEKNLLHVFAVLLRQCSVLKPSSMIKQLLVFSWVVGAMFLCLAYDSVVLSFLSFPPVIQVKDVPQLANAIKEGYYHCLVYVPVRSPIPRLLLKSKDENLKIIGRDLQMNNLSILNIYDDFYYDRNLENLALIAPTKDIGVLNVGRKFFSQDHFLESIWAMPIRKDFCCKKLIEKFVHRMMASGLFFKYNNDRVFLLRLPGLMKYEEKVISKRVLTLTDVAPAFIFLIFGHIISLLVLIVEILTNRLKKKERTWYEYRI